MLDSFELFLLGFACVIDTVLLLVVFERINYPRVAVWLKLLIVGNWLVHIASFFHRLLKPVTGFASVQLDQACMVFLAIGLLILPSAMLHCAIRLNHTGVIAFPGRDRRYALLYLPMLSIPMVAGWIFNSGSRDFLVAVGPIQEPYLIWLVVANATAVLLFWRLRVQRLVPGAASFFQYLSIAIIAITLFAGFYVVKASSSSWEMSIRMITVLSPLVPAFLFVWYILRQRLLPLVIERTFVYGGILAVVLLLHRLTITPLASAMSDRSNLDFVLIEWICLFGLVMLWRPMRERVRASLRYLLSSDVFQVRDATRKISVQLSQQTSRSTEELIEWFSKVLRENIAVEFASIELLDSKSLDKSIADSNRSNDQAAIAMLAEGLRNQADGYLNRADIVEPRQLEALESLNADVAIRIAFRSIDGVALLGPRLRSDRLADEQLTALAMLCDQFAATLFNRNIELERLRFERHWMQQEKLSVLGLIAGSLAHELRNPLSSIRTIATLMQEDMPEGDEHFRDVSMIVAEIDRLSQTTQRLLDYARPSDICGQTVVPDKVIERLPTWASPRRAGAAGWAVPCCATRCAGPRPADASAPRSRCGRTAPRRCRCTCNAVFSRRARACIGARTGWRVRPPADGPRRGSACNCRLHHEHRQTVTSWTSAQDLVIVCRVMG